MHIDNEDDLIAVPAEAEELGNLGCRLPRQEKPSRNAIRLGWLLRREYSE